MERQIIKKYDKRNEGGFPASLLIPEGFHNLIYTRHAMERFEARHGNDPIFPTLVNINKNSNVLEIYPTEINGREYVSQMLISIQYTKKKNDKIYLILIPYANKTAVVKTLWFSKNRKKDDTTKIHISNSDVRFSTELQPVKE